MPWSSGSYTRSGTVHTGAAIWVDSAGDGDAVISSTEHDDHDEDLKGGIDACINKDGSNAYTGNADLGSQKIVSLAEGTATGQGMRWDEGVASIGLTGTTLDVTMNDTLSLTVDLASVGSAGEVTLAGDQTITGKKTFTTNTTPITDLRVLDTVYHKINELTAGGTVAVDTTASSHWFLNNTQAMTLSFTIPAASSDTDLGNNFTTNGAIMIRNGSGAGALTLSVSASDTQEIGSRPTGAGVIYTLVYQVLVLNATTRYVQFTWVTA